MYNAGTTFIVNNHDISIITQPKLTSLEGMKDHDGSALTGTAWVATGEWGATDNNPAKLSFLVPVTLVWKAVDGDAEGNAVDWDNPWLILPDYDDYLANPVSGFVAPKGSWQQDFEEMTEEEWGGPYFEDGGLVEVVPNIPGQTGYDEYCGDWRNA